MKKQDYQAPSMRVVKLQHRSRMLSGSVNEVKSLGNNLDEGDAIRFGGEDTDDNYNTYGIR